MSLAGVPESAPPTAFPIACLELMRKTTLLLLSLVVILVAAGGLFVLTWEIPPPTVPVEKVLSDDRFPN